MDPKDQQELDNRSNQLNPNNAEYHNSRLNNDDDDDDDDDNDVKSNSAESDDYYDNESDDFDEEWIPQDAW